MLKFHTIIIKFSIFTAKNSQSDTFFPTLKNTIVKIDIKSFPVQKINSCSFYHVNIKHPSILNFNQGVGNSRIKMCTLELKYPEYL